MVNRRNALLFALSTLGMASCTGSLPASGTLPNIDGRNVTNVQVTQVGGVDSATVASGATTVAAATDGATASTLVKRDASGGFSANQISANQITAAIVGKSGGAIQVATSLALSGGNYFTVIGDGTLGEITGLPALAQVTLAFTGSVTLIHDNSKLRLRDAVNHVTQAGEMITFFSPQANVWQEISRVGPRTRVFLTPGSSGTTSVAANGGILTSTTLVWKSVVTDTLSEYEPNTGKFTAKQGGYYEFTSTLMLGTGAGGWVAGEGCELVLQTTTRSYVAVGSLGLGFCSATLHAHILMAPGDVAVFIANNSSTTSKLLYPDAVSGAYVTAYSFAQISAD